LGDDVYKAVAELPRGVQRVFSCKSANLSFEEFCKEWGELDDHTKDRWRKRTEEGGYEAEDESIRAEMRIGHFIGKIVDTLHFGYKTIVLLNVNQKGEGADKNDTNGDAEDLHALHDRYVEIWREMREVPGLSERISCVDNTDGISYEDFCEMRSELGLCRRDCVNRIRSFISNA